MDGNSFLLIMIALGGLLMAIAAYFLFKSTKPDNSQSPPLPQKASPPVYSSASLPTIPKYLETKPVTPYLAQDEKPFGIKLITFLNWVAIVLNTLSILIALATYPFLLKTLNVADKPAPHNLIKIIAFALAASITLLIFLVNQGLWNYKRWARVTQIVFAVLGLFIFPVGTVLSAIFLYFLLLDPNTVEAFRENQHS